MPLEQTITIINNSGKIISTGKHLVNIFKDAQAAYKEKKASIKAERAGLSRAATFDVGRRQPTLYDEPNEHNHQYHAPYHGHQQHRGAPYVGYEEPRYIEDRRRSIDDRCRSHDDVSRASSTTSRSTRRPPRRSQTSRPPLTENNLRTHSEVSSTAPSRAPQPRSPGGYRSPYAETAPHDMALSRPNLEHAQPQSYLGSVVSPSQYQGGEGYQSTIVSSPRQSMHVGRPRSDPSLRKRAKSIDMHLAYGNLPPDLASRVDLEPKMKDNPEAEARTLMSRIEGLLTEAHCLHFTASAIIAHLQGNPDAAAAVALTLAELSAVLGKLGPGFLSVVKGGSPAVFALLASPQFLIGTGIAVGVTVIMFGGWKIVRRMQQAAAIKKEEEASKMAFEMSSPDACPGPMPGGGQQGFAAGARFGAGRSVGGGSFDEALFIEEELSTIETWRRGIEPFAEDGSVIESVEAELISPEALRSMRGDDAQTIRTSKTYKSHKSHRSSGGKIPWSRKAPDDIPERTSSKGEGKEKNRDRDREREGERDRDERSESGSHRSGRSSRSKRSERTEVRMIEDGRRQESDSIEMVLRPKKNSMLKSLFKKKKDKAGQKERSEVSVRA